MFKLSEERQKEKIKTEQRYSENGAYLKRHRTGSMKFGKCTMRLWNQEVNIVIGRTVYGIKQISGSEKAEYFAFQQSILMPLSHALTSSAHFVKAVA